MATGEEGDGLLLTAIDEEEEAGGAEDATVIASGHRARLAAAAKRGAGVFSQGFAMICVRSSIGRWVRTLCVVKLKDNME